MNGLAQHVIILPVLLPLIAGAAMLLLDERRRTIKTRISIGASLAIAASAVWLLAQVEDPLTPQAFVYHLADWTAPFGIVLVADRLSALMVLVTALLGAAGLTYSLSRWALLGPRFHSLYLFLLMGLCGAFLTGDLFNLFVAFEVMLAASYVLITLGGRAEQVRSGMTYVIINLVASTLLVTTVGLIYAATGSVNMAEVAVRLQEVPDGVRQALGGLLLVTFGIKAAIFPLFFWLPDSYPTAPVTVTAVFAGLLTKIGVYAIIRSQTLLFPSDEPMVLLLVLAGLTMVVGVAGAAEAQLLAVHLELGPALLQVGPPDALEGRAEGVRRQGVGGALARLGRPEQVLHRQVEPGQLEVVGAEHEHARDLDEASEGVDERLDRVGRGDVVPGGHDHVGLQAREPAEEVPLAGLPGEQVDVGHVQQPDGVGPRRQDRHREAPHLERGALDPDAVREAARADGRRAGGEAADHPRPLGGSAGGGSLGGSDEGGALVGSGVGSGLGAGPDETSRRMVLNCGARSSGEMPRKVPAGLAFSCRLIEVPKPASCSTARHSFRPMREQLGTSTVGGVYFVGGTNLSRGMPSRAARIAGSQMPWPASRPELPLSVYELSRIRTPWRRRSSSLMPLKRSCSRSMPIMAAPARFGV